MKKCTKCEKEKNLTEFYTRKKPNGVRYASECKSCALLYKKEQPVKPRKNKQDRKEYFRNRRKNDLLFKIQTNVSASLRNCLNEKFFSKKSRTYEILGCSFDEFKIYIESKFEPWMNWCNHGKYTGNYNETWQFDHITPISSAETEEELIKLHHYTNYQPLCSKVNQIDKKDRIDYKKEMQE